MVEKFKIIHWRFSTTCVFFNIVVERRLSAPLESNDIVLTKLWNDDNSNDFQDSDELQT